MTKTPETPIAESIALGRAIMATRIEAGLSRRDLATAIGYSYPYVSEWEQGAKVMTVAAMLKVTEACGVPRGFLVERMEDILDRYFPDYRTEA